MDATTRPDPLGPLDFGISILTWLTGILLALVVLATAFGSGSFLGFGDTEACVTTRIGAVADADLPQGGAGGSGVVGLEKGARSMPQTFEVCAPDPGAALQVGAAIGPAAELGLLLGSLWLTRRLIRCARRTRLFGSGVATRTRQLGWFLLGGSILAAALQSLSIGIVLSAALQGVSWTSGQQDFDVPVTLMLVGLGVLTVGRVLDRAVAIQEDADATI